MSLKSYMCDIHGKSEGMEHCSVINCRYGIFSLNHGIHPDLKIQMPGCQCVRCDKKSNVYLDACMVLAGAAQLPYKEPERLERPTLDWMKYHGENVEYWSNDKSFKSLKFFFSQRFREKKLREIYAKGFNNGYHETDKLNRKEI